MSRDEDPQIWFLNDEERDKFTVMFPALGVTIAVPLVQL